MSNDHKIVEWIISWHYVNSSRKNDENNFLALLGGQCKYKILQIRSIFQTHFSFFNFTNKIHEQD